MGGLPTSDWALIAVLDRLSRPKNLDEVSAQDNTVQVLKKTLESANVSRERMASVV